MKLKKKLSIWLGSFFMLTSVAFVSACSIILPVNESIKITTLAVNAERTSVVNKYNDLVAELLKYEKEAESSSLDEQNKKIADYFAISVGEIIYERELRSKIKKIKNEQVSIIAKHNNLDNDKLYKYNNSDIKILSKTFLIDDLSFINKNIKFYLSSSKPINHVFLKKNALLGNVRTIVFNDGNFVDVFPVNEIINDNIKYIINKNRIRIYENLLINSIQINESAQIDYSQHETLVANDNWNKYYKNQLKIIAARKTIREIDLEVDYLHQLLKEYIIK